MTFRQATWDEPLLSELSRGGRRAFSLPKISSEILSKVGDLPSLLPKAVIREKPAKLPELSEPQVLRHYVRLSQTNFAIDAGMYPLGSCTMKYNPKVSERICRNPKLANLHPYQDPSTLQGILRILHELDQMLCEITGMRKFSLAPAAGAQGEYVGALIISNRLREQGRSAKDEMLVPDSAHGTNPASAAMAGFKVVKIPSSAEGIVTVEALKEVLSPRTAGMMLTVPNTLGIFEREIAEVAATVHEAGGLMYYDGANMNALLGRVRPGDMGFDIVHINVHKTFATPHGGGGPGAGPVGVSEELDEYLPVPRIERSRSTEEDSYYIDYERPKTIGFIKSFYGNIAVLVRAYCYLLSMGGDGLRAASEQAVLASNYLLSLLDREAYSLKYSPDIPRKHEFVVSASPIKRKTGVTAGDIAKAILDWGTHSPTTYFPLIVDEALMVEPTETEPQENLKAYADIMNRIAESAVQHKESIVLAPARTTVSRLDDYKASHPNSMILNWNELTSSTAAAT